jgi:hypothetical protein
MSWKDRSVEVDIASALRAAKESRSGAVVVWGAGGSVTAGIPTAKELVDEIRRDYPSHYDRAVRKTYRGVMGQLPPQLRRELIGKHVDRARLNWAHIALAQLIQDGFIQRVFSVNFDPLLVRACVLLGYDGLAVYDLAAGGAYDHDLVIEPAVVYLHGQRAGMVLANTEEETRRQASLARRVFEGARNYVWLVIGYSGIEDDLFPELVAVKPFSRGLYWAHLDSHEPQGRVDDDLLKDPESYASVVPIQGADELMVGIARRLGCFPPALFYTPSSHLQRTLELKPLTPWKIPDSGGPDLLLFTSEVLERARHASEDEQASRLLRIAAEDPVQVPDVLSGSVAFVRANPLLARVVARACVLAAQKYEAEAREADSQEDGRDGTTVKSLYGRAKRSYQLALDSDPNHSESATVQARLSALEASGAGDECQT